MCLLTYYPGGVPADSSLLRDGAEVNPDGHGFAIVTPQSLIVERGMDAPEMITRFAKMREVHPDGPALFHSRWASHGTITLDNCHPFPVGGDPRTVVAHNGVLPVPLQPSDGDERSDTRIAAEDFLPTNPFGSLNSNATLGRMAKWMGQHNKIVILTVDPRYRRNAYLINEDRGHWLDGAWYSNTDFLIPEQPWPGWSLPCRRSDLGELTCPICQCEDALDVERSVCTVCGGCPDCCESVYDCQCYQPTRLGHEPPHAVVRATSRTR